MFLGVDGGGTKTAYTLVDADGHIHAEHVGISVSHLSEGFARATELLIEGIDVTLRQAGIRACDVTFAFLGLPSYGEDSATTAKMDVMPAERFTEKQYRCGNDMVCSWAGSLACLDGISVIAGTGSMAYGQFERREARAGGWGELIGDEGSAYWIAREGMNLFSRMSDGRMRKGPLHDCVRAALKIDVDLDLCSHVYGKGAGTRNTFAQFAKLVHEAAQGGDARARDIFRRAADELVQCVLATRRSLSVPDSTRLPVSHSGGVFNATLMVEEFKASLAAADRPFEYCAPQFSPAPGAALYAAKLIGQPLSAQALGRLRLECAPKSSSHTS